MGVDQSFKSNMYSAQSIDPSPLLGDNTHTPPPTNEIVHDAPKESTLCDNVNDHTPTGIFSSTKLYLFELSRIFSGKFLSWLAIYGCCISGGSYKLVTAISLPLFKQMGISASRLQLYTSMIKSPRAMKPFIGVTSDLFPLMGYNMRYVALVAILFGFAASFVLIRIIPLADIEKQEGPNAVPLKTIADWILVCFVAISGMSATFDILAQGKYSEIMRSHPGVGTSITSFKLFWSRVGKVIVQSYVGPLSDKGEFHVIFLMSLVYSIMPLLPTLAGWIPEEKRTMEEPGMMALCGRLLLFDRGAFEGKKVVFILITLSGLSPLLYVLVTWLAGPNIGLAFAAVLIFIFCAATYFIFPRRFFRIFVSIVITRLSLIQIPSAMGYYYTATAECIPNGPHFSYTYYITIAGITGSIMSLFSVVLYQKVFANWKFRSGIAISIVIGAFAAIADIILIFRWNIDIGIPDKVFFMFGNAIFAQFIVTIQVTPLDSICSKMAPPGMGSAVTAFVLGMFEFCGIVTDLIGSKVIDWSRMKTEGDDCDFQALPALVVMTQILIPIIIGIPAIFLIPNVFQTENLIDWEQEGWSTSS